LSQHQTVDIRPLTPERWPDLEGLFGPRGAVGGCWCMWFRQPAREFEQNKGEANRRALRQITDDRPPGLLAYVDGSAVGWCSLAPRDEFSRLERSRILKRVDDEPVWSVVCFFIHKKSRGQGVAAALLSAAASFAAARGARILEGYPVDPKGRAADPWAYTGTTSMFRAAGFDEVLRRSPGRPIMRKRLD
jgi:GNAT superfamily N-acetyltransferase